MMLARDNVYDIYVFMRDNDVADIIKIDIGARMFLAFVPQFGTDDYLPGGECYYIYRYTAAGNVFTLGRYCGLGDAHDAFDVFVKGSRSI
jgi:hypothetical protein